MERYTLYDLTLSFEHVYHYSTESPEEFLTSGALINATQLELKTTDGSVLPMPRLYGTRVNEQGKFEFEVADLRRGVTYDVEFKEDLLPSTPWMLLERISMRASTTYRITDDNSLPAHRSRYYRVTNP